MSLKIVNADTNRIFEFYSRPPDLRSAVVKQRHVALQKGTSAFQSRAPAAVINTPTKMLPPTAAVATTSGPSATPIVGMPGRKTSPRQPPKKKAVNNLCKVCRVIYDSKEDKAMSKKHGRQNTWLACDVMFLMMMMMMLVMMTMMMTMTMVMAMMAMMMMMIQTVTLIKVTIFHEDSVPHPELENPQLILEICD